MPDINQVLPIRLSERSVRFGDDSTEASDLLWNEMSRAAREADGLLSLCAVHWFHLNRLAQELAQCDGLEARFAEGVQILCDNLKDQLDQRSVIARDLTGTEFTESLQQQVELRASTANDGVTAPVVVHTEEPPVFRHGRLIAKGAVLVEMPARRGSQPKSAEPS